MILFDPSDSVSLAGGKSPILLITEKYGNR